MTVLTLGADPELRPGAFVARANPVAKLAVALLVSLTLLLTVDVVTAGVALALEVAALPWCGLSPRGLLRRGWIVLVGAVPAGLVTMWLGVDSGEVLLALGPVTVTQGSFLAGCAIALRILSVGLPGVVLLATTDPTDLADALAQVARLPHRFVLSALAAMRLFALMGTEWESLGAARRARGIGDDGAVGRARTTAGQVLALLVLVIRRGTRLAMAMEARGFGGPGTRTWARTSRLRRSDVGVVIGGVVIVTVATAAGMLAGTWHLALT
ncbi:energy-coupling factor transporter transmembrane protein EcfT [Cellulomonas sp. P24]|uniref:energy-coupling factor transporter transmembrane component T family protein n=1 Tax=Cellulomonas sp. P24 TaxID=2885206 RepID=UPI00216B04CA|nr:energy-coupling factor transporter transmembrane component T [Cellulomonas sp. P24]MCR6492695.1 energy-coupling factor transporter transmembrane protein EcfT [Cellulomonas sp. P24]